MTATLVHPAVIVINTCNRPFLLKQLVSDVKEQMDDEDQIIIVNDGDEGSADSLAGDNVDVIDHCKDYYALASGRNAGMDRALELGYHWGVYMDDDCTVEDSWLDAHKRSWLDEGTIYAGKITVQDQEHDVRKNWWDGEGSFVVKWGGSNMSCHLPSLKGVGGFDEQFDGNWGYEDNELYHRLTKQYNWNVKYIENSEVVNLQAPASGDYQRGDTANREMINPEATYKDFDSEPEQVGSVWIKGVEAKFIIEDDLEKKRITSLRGERKVVKEILDEIDSDDLFWDVGACVGTHTCLIAQKADRVEAFEPSPVNYERLKENIELNNLNNVEVLNQALGKEKKKGHLSYESGEPGEGLHHISDEGYEVIVMQGDYSTGCYPDVAKIDVEGAEYEVLIGMKDILASDKLRTLFMEIHPVDIQKYDGSIEEIYNLLGNNGFDVDTFHKANNRRFIKAKK